MSRLWRWLFVNRKAESLQQELDRLHAEIGELLKRQNEWRETSEAAFRESDLARTEAELTLSSERQQSAKTIAELNSALQHLETSLATNRQRAMQLEQSQHSLNDLVKFREQEIEEIRTTNAHELQSRETKIQSLERKLRDLEADLTSVQLMSASQVADLNQQLTSINERVSSRTDRDAAKILELEQQLRECEAHSEDRAEQRSALLRNLAEIHRLSSLITKSELAYSSFKLIPTDSYGSNNHDAHDAEGVPLPHYSTWNVYGDVESA